MFPSEIAADYWRRHGSEYVSGRALRTDRFVSWDTYKEQFLSISSSLTPANKIARRLFAAALCNEAASGESEVVLPFLIPSAFSHRARRFARSIAGIIPSLRNLVDDVASGRLEIGKDLYADFQLLYAKYCTFLETHGLYEPSYLGIRSGDTGGEKNNPVCIFYPELIDDFGRYADHLGAVDQVHSPEPESYEVRRFETVVEEIEYVIGEVARLLSSGTHPEHIVITVAGIESAADHLLEISRLCSVPLDFRAGKAFSDYSEGALFSRITQCVAKRFDVEAMKSLLLDPRIPWKNRSLNRDLIRAGVSLRVGRNRDRDVWLDRLGDDSRIAGYYRSLRDHFSRIASASDFGKLRSGVLDLVNNLLDVSKDPNDENRRILEGVIDTLAPFESIASRIGLAVENPAATWLEFLAEQIYVVRGPAEGVAVYPYRVTAGMHPKYHFIVNVADASARITQTEFSFLPRHVLEGGRNGYAEQDATRAFLRAYAVSGETVHFSYSARGPSGAMLTPSEFVLLGADSDDSGAMPRNPYLSERAFWSGDAFPKAIYPVQLLGFEHAFPDESDAPGPRVTDTGQFELFADNHRASTASAHHHPTGTITDTGLVSMLASRMKNDLGQVSISPTTLDAWTRCRFAFLISYLLDVDEDEYTVSASDPRIEGGLLHELVGALLQDVDTLADASPDDDRVSAIITRYGGRISAKYPQPFSLLTFDFLETVRKVLLAFLEHERQVNPSGGAGEFEQDLREVFDGIELKGRIDRLFAANTGGNESHAIIDYKRGYIPSRTDLAVFESASTYQIPMYMLLAESKGYRIDAAYYYSLLKGKTAKVFVSDDKRSWFTRDDLELFKQTVLSRIDDMASAIEGGDYRTTDVIGACDGCSLRSICRERYVVRRGMA